MLWGFWSLGDDSGENVAVDWENAAVGGKNASGGEEKTAVGKKTSGVGENGVSGIYYVVAKGFEGSGVLGRRFPR